MIVQGDKIRSLREERGYSLAELARKAGLSVSYLSEIERGAKQPSLRTVDKIANALRVNRGLLVKKEPENRGLSIGEKIRLLREEKGLSLSQLAKEVKLSVSYLSEIERGSVAPGLATVKKIAEALNVPVFTIMAPVNSTGYKLKLLREEQGLTQAQLAEKAGVSAGLIGQIEHGRVQPSLKTLEKIGEALGVAPCYFVLDEEGPEQMIGMMGPELRELLCHPNVKSVLRLICHLNEEEIKFILNFIQLFKKAKITDFN
ncbi:helix-turn-helix domain-containing protein [Calderihabitans maritimus]|uniref:Putative transcriptional regulator n=1 Tax=Calderihabitans maritimus TaxID=1246530 RepID=A0A1Z5HU02_9FIRM|nr:helix-turn-helix domain-containing protein [Calderihabitans maritimus]GAW93016.1 putative transcriptional regulator [Calderihabitans maritimus]